MRRAFPAANTKHSKTEQWPRLWVFISSPAPGDNPLVKLLQLCLQHRLRNQSLINGESRDRPSCRGFFDTWRGSTYSFFKHNDGSRTMDLHLHPCFSPETSGEALDGFLSFSVKSILKKKKYMFIRVPLFTWRVD